MFPCDFFHVFAGAGTRRGMVARLEVCLALYLLIGLYKKWKLSIVSFLFDYVVIYMFVILKFGICYPPVEFSGKLYPQCLDPPSFVNYKAALREQCCSTSCLHLQHLCMCIVCKCHWDPAFLRCLLVSFPRFVASIMTLCWMAVKLEVAPSEFIMRNSSVLCWRKCWR